MGVPALPPPDSSRPVVLVVDDEPAVRHFMVQALSESYRVLEAADGREALALFEVAGTSIAAVVTDVRMPEVDGLALAKALQARRPAPAILFVSGFGIGGELPAPFLDKPFHPEDLLAAVQQMLAGSHEEPRRV